MIVHTTHGPLCPYDGAFQNDAHRRDVDVRDAEYRALASLRDANGDLPEDLDAAVAKEHQGVRGGMRLYVVEDGGTAAVGGHIWARGAYWQCPVCGFVLPATELGT